MTFNTYVDQNRKLFYYLLHMNINIYLPNIIMFVTKMKLPVQVTVSDFRYMMENLKVSVTENEIEEMIKDADKNHNGYIPYNGNISNLLFIYSKRDEPGYYYTMYDMRTLYKCSIFPFTFLVGYLHSF